MLSDYFPPRVPLLLGSEATPKMLLEPIAVACTLYNDSVLIENPTTRSALGTGEGKSESDREPSPGDDVHSETTVS